MWGAFGKATDIGCDQAYLLAKQIQKMDLGIDCILSGTLLRARQTAMIINGVLGGLEMEYEEKLNERAIGEWNKRTIAETEDLITRKVPPVGGETEEQFTARISAALWFLLSYAGRKPLIVSSKCVGRVINTLLGGAGSLQVANGEIVEFLISPNPDGSTDLRVRHPSYV